MGESIPTARQIEGVFRLSYFITGDRRAALDIAARAAEGWERTFREQRERPRSKKYPERLRQKLIMNRTHALQLLAYKLCEPVEKAQERGQSRGEALPHADFFVVRYIKHLLFKTVPHRSFHVAVGLCELLYDYRRRETVEVYKTLTQGDYRLEKDEQMYKDWKLALMSALQSRFPGLLVAGRGPHGESRFAKMADQQRVAALVMNSLKLFTPWGTTCPLPAGTLGGNGLKSLEFTGRDPDQEHPVEERRMHTLIGPECFSLLTGSLHLDPPLARLAVPCFNQAGGDGELLPPPAPDELPRLSPDELFDIADRLNRRRQRLKATPVSSLVVEVEGVERSAFDLDEQRSVRLALGADDDLLQVFTVAGGEKLLLASLLTSGSGIGGDEERWHGAIRLARGRELRITVTPVLPRPGQSARATVEIEFVAARTLFRLMRLAWSNALAALKRRQLVWAAATAVLIAAFLLYGYFWRGPKRGANLTRDGRAERPVNQATLPHHDTAQEAAQNSTGEAHATPPGPVPARTPASHPRPEGKQRTPSVTNGNRVATAARVESLNDVRRVFVSPGRSAAERQLHDELLAALRASGRFTVVDNQTEADATLSTEPARGATISVQLTNGASGVLWYKVTEGFSEDDPGGPRAAAANIVRSLLDDDARTKRRRGGRRP